MVSFVTSSNSAPSAEERKADRIATPPANNRSSSVAASRPRTRSRVTLVVAADRTISLAQCAEQRRGCGCGPPEAICEAIDTMQHDCRAWRGLPQAAAKHSVLMVGVFEQLTWTRKHRAAGGVERKRRSTALRN